VTVAKGLVTHSGEIGRLVIREDTGELRELVREEVKATMQKGRLAALRKELGAAVGQRIEEVSLPEALARLLGAAIRSAALGLPGTPEQRKQAGIVAARLARAGGAWAEELVAALESRPETEFEIPTSIDVGTVAGSMRMQAMALVTLADAVFPRQSWPWLLARETACVLCGKDRYAMQSLGAIYQSEQTGPIGFLATARLLTLVNPPLSRSFAERGIGRLSADAFRRDYRLFLGSGDEAGKGVLRLVESLRGLSPEEVEAVAVVLGPKAGGVFRESMRALRGRHKGASARDAFSATLEYWWEEYLREVVRAELGRLAGVPRPPAQ